MRPPQRKLSDLFKFSKPKTPGYEISKDYYLSVLAGTPTLPSCRAVMTPKGENGAIPGMLAPLGGKDKSVLEAPMQRGVYAIAAPDQKTILKLMIMPRDEAGFDPEPFLRSPIAQSFGDETRTRVAATWHVMQLTFEAFEPSIFPALDFFLLTARRLAELTGGVVADPICQRYLLPEQVICSPRRRPELDAREHIVFRPTTRREGLYTFGMVKFALPEIELPDVPTSHLLLAESFLLNLCEAILLGNVLEPGAMVGPFLVAHGGTDLAQWEGIPVYELLPAGKKSVAEELDNWASQVAP